MQKAGQRVQDSTPLRYGAPGSPCMRGGGAHLMQLGGWLPQSGPLNKLAGTWCGEKRRSEELWSRDSTSDWLLSL